MISGLTLLPGGLRETEMYWGTENWGTGKTGKTGKTGVVVRTLFERQYVGVTFWWFPKTGMIYEEAESWFSLCRAMCTIGEWRVAKVALRFPTKSFLIKIIQLRRVWIGILITILYHHTRSSTYYKSWDGWMGER